MSQNALDDLIQESFDVRYRFLIEIPETDLGFRIVTVLWAIHRSNGNESTNTGQHEY